ncbi:hypothetical protein [Veronia nyctiphanis]|uniref:hypothetical protein n=1 Tax=Veronia nyctiphanis TaxID=1278244 RepID=UPI001F3350E9|nr:hypothetical protein [Veronia nyctiphanis]
MKVNALAPEEREKMRKAAQPAVEAQIESALGEPGVMMMKQFLKAVDDANSTHYLQ